MDTGETGSAGNHLILCRICEMDDSNRKDYVFDSLAEFPCAVVIKCTNPGHCSWMMCLQCARSKKSMKNMKQIKQHCYLYYNYP